MAGLALENKQSEKRFKSIVEKINRYNKIAKILKSFKIFPGTVLLFKREEDVLYIELADSKLLERENFERHQDISNIIKIDLTSLDDVAWFLTSLKIAVSKRENFLNKASEYSKPTSGILIYDEEAKEYFVNPNCNAILIDSKILDEEISKAYWSTFVMIRDLRSPELLAKVENEILGESTNSLLRICINIKNIIMHYYKLLVKVELFPKYWCQLKSIDENNWVLECKLLVKEEQKINDTEIYPFEINDLNSLSEIYKKLRYMQAVNESLFNFSKKLLLKAKPQWYLQSEKNKFWYLTYNGKQLLDKIKIFSFLNDKDDQELLEI